MREPNEGAGKGTGLGACRLGAYWVLKEWCDGGGDRDVKDAAKTDYRPPIPSIAQIRQGHADMHARNEAAAAPRATIFLGREAAYGQFYAMRWR
jgi:hypothetical protein